MNLTDVPGDPNNCLERVSLALECIYFRQVGKGHKALGSAFIHLDPLQEYEFPTVKSRQIFCELMNKQKYWNDKLNKYLEECGYDLKNDKIWRAIGDEFGPCRGKASHWLCKRIWDLYTELISHIRHGRK